MGEFEQFVADISEIIGENLGDNFEVRVRKIKKNNCHEKTGLTICDKSGMYYKNGVAPTFYLEEIYETFKESRDIYELAQIITERFKESVDAAKLIDMSVLDGNNVENNIFYRIVNYNENKDILENVPHICFEDLVVTFRCLCGSTDNGVNSFLINDSIMKGWGMSEARLLSLARRNTPLLFPEKLVRITEVLKDLGAAAGIPYDITDDEDDMKLYVLTNTVSINGATVILYSKKIYELCNKMDCNMYVIPSSIHELILIPECDEVDPHYIGSMINDVNNNVVPPEEILSYNVYYYSRENRQISIVSA